MHVVAFTQAPFYSAPGHAQMSMQRLQGMEAGPSDSVWIGCSLIEPGGGTISSASEVEKFYICLEGELQVTAIHGNESQVAVLRPMDSCRIAPQEARQLFNAGSSPARVLLVMPNRI
ncbi:MAG: cupin domain-containing protein [Comamonas sp.]|nr:cupin domain-containing protein [Comamonas sp.]